MIQPVPTAPTQLCRGARTVEDNTLTCAARSTTRGDGQLPTLDGLADVAMPNMTGAICRSERELFDGPSVDPIRTMTANLPWHAAIAVLASTPVVGGSTRCRVARGHLVSRVS